jgi:hypothetical protein
MLIWTHAEEGPPPHTHPLPHRTTSSILVQ